MNQQIFILPFLVTVLSCNSSRQELSGTDTGNPVIQVSVLDSKGAPLENADVIIYRQSENGSAILRKESATDCDYAIDTLHTDSEGKVSLKAEPGATLGLEVYWNESLGLYKSIVVAETNNAVELNTKPLVNFPTESDVVFANTGRRLPAGSVTKIPPGLWLIKYIQLGSTDTLPSIEVQVEDAANLPEALTSLNQAASELNRLDIKTRGYVEFADYPDDPKIAEQLEYTCAMDGYDQVTSCKGALDCRVWQWESDWSSQQDHVSVIAGALTKNGKILCILFPDDAISKRPIFYPFTEVRKNP